MKIVQNSVIDVLKDGWLTVSGKERIEFICNLIIAEQSKIWPYLDSIDFLSWWRWPYHSHRNYHELWHQHLNWEERVTLWKRLPWNNVNNKYSFQSKKHTYMVPDPK